MLASKIPSPAPSGTGRALWGAAWKENAPPARCGAQRPPRSQQGWGAYMVELDASVDGARGGKRRLWAGREEWLGGSGPVAWTSLFRPVSRAPRAGLRACG